MIAHAIAYLFGTVLGVISGWGLSWWCSGVTGWLLLFGLVMLYALLNERNTNDLEKERAVAWGAAFGAWSGGAAADVPEALDGLVWPGHEVDGCIAAVVVAVAWLLGCIINRDDQVDQPLSVGLVLYALTLALAYGPPLWEVL